ncbi:ATP-binding protein [Desulfovibrio inopinatus]|uniref:ATP-binding protein n=1 Tax=Desulfovibrio inopinatus TaxID=102109 RepID=UPI000415109C|nr:ATP-binding protein [Desulfovibrio inopinatus]
MIGRFKKLSLQVKIFVATLAVVLFISLTIAMLARWILVSSLTRELEMRGVAIAQSIAERGSGFILDDDKPALISLVFDATLLGERKILISYIFVVNDQGQILAHTFIRPFPKGLLHINPLPPDKETAIKLIEVAGEEAYDIAVPVKEGIYTLGTVHVGLNKSHIDNLVGKLRITFLGFISAIVVIIFVIALKISNSITRPLSQLTKISDEISRGNLDIPLSIGDGPAPESRQCPAYLNTDLPCWHFDQDIAETRDVLAIEPRTCKECDFYRKREGDEVAQLADSFNNMVWSIKLYRKRLRESEGKYRSLFNSNPDPVFVMDKETSMILDANPRAEEVYGYTRNQLVGMSAAQLEPVDGRSVLNQFLNCPLDSECVFFDKLRHVKHDGTAFFVNIHACRIAYKNRDAVIFSATDVTDMVEKDAQLIQAGKMKTLGEMSAGIAHELNQPLNAIKMGSDFLGLLIDRSMEMRPEQLKTVTAEISKQVDRATLIINHLREFGRKSELRTERVDINVPIRGVFTIIGQQLSLQNIRVQLDLAENLPPVRAHANRLEQIFFNLVSNARDAINHNQESNQKPREIAIRSIEENNKVVVTVSDTGCGIPPQDLDKVFEPFFTTKQTGQGMGLGLAISYGIVKDYGGNIEVGSEPGEGTTFKLSFSPDISA